MDKVSTDNNEHWSRTKALMVKSLIIWFVFSFVIHFFVKALNEFSFLGFSVGFYMAAQGSLIVFVCTIFYFSYKQNKIDEECNVDEQ